MVESTQTPAARPAGVPSGPRGLRGRDRTRAALVELLPGDHAARAASLVKYPADVPGPSA